MNSPIKLVVEGGTLHTLKSDIVDKLMSEWFSENPVLVRHYDGGDVDTIAWPLVDSESLAIALYDAREMGIIPSVQSVILPDGTSFGIDFNLGGIPEPIVQPLEV